MRKFRPAFRVLAFTLAPCMTDASGWKLSVLAFIVGLSAINGWADLPWED